MEYVTYAAGAFVAIFVIVDPFSVVPIYLTLSHGHSKAEMRATRHKASWIAGIILTAFAITGMGIFNVFGITLPAFQIAGGLMLLMLGLEQLNAKRSRVKAEEEREGMVADDISVFPLATPLLAGPGAISTVVLYASSADSWRQLSGLVIAIVATIVSANVLLAMAPKVFAKLGQTGLNLFTRLMGIILSAIAVQFILDGIRGAIKASV